MPCISTVLASGLPLSICLSVCSAHSCIISKWPEVFIKLFSGLNNPIILVFEPIITQFKGNPSATALNMGWVVAVMAVVVVVVMAVVVVVVVVAVVVVVVVADVVIVVICVCVRAYVCVLMVMQMVGTLSLFTCPTLMNRCRYLTNTSGHIKYSPELCIQGLLKVTHT